ncbi:MAG: tRNA dihydrouridine(20/20a) synthase DusA [Gammaproteobacteria bacterium]
MVQLDRKLSVAPMMGCTDRHCRYLLRLLSPQSLLYSEMLTSGALIHGDTERILAHTGDAPAALQLGGSDPEDLATCAAMIEQAGYQEVNLNCGCPSDRVQQGGIGACLMAEPELVADCYRAMAERVSLPVTIKSRIGIDDHDSYEFFHRFIAIIYEAGCRIFIVHARTAVLSGLSPKENREVPPLKYDYVTRIKHDFPDAAFVLNGGITNVDQAVKLSANCDGVMLGRAPYSNPYLLAELDAALFGNQPASREDAMTGYLAYMQQEIEHGTHIKHMAKHLLGLYTGMPGARAFRRHLSTHMYQEEAGLEVVIDALACVRENLQETGT